MPTDLDITALRTLTAIADCGGYRRAAEALHVSQSTVSQHVRKLESMLGRCLLEPKGRTMRFTPDGELLLAEVRQLLAVHDALVTRFGDDDAATVVVGATEHAAEHLLPQVTQAFRAALPEVQLRFRLDRGANLHEGLDHGTVDVAVLLGSARPGSVKAGLLPLHWYAAPGWAPPARSRAIPLVVIDGPCTVRRKAVQTLTEAGRRHRIVAEAGYLAGVLNAVRAGLGVALLANPGPTPEGLERRDDLPAVSPEPLHVRAAETASPQLLPLVTEAIRHALAS
ncbi:LysR family transcriptional regulator [Dactylosporangium fulvum]|uniref:LysR substrate-binding domain-containing protein n=1 Tax=Dactylosporangium fulvum TaxID=53359 RepID=A0ABY5VP45_9ACTN|nr:LysR substrate-binding domain-containing protein [Dactylosporangium fulvum]UWP78927.1 LysR substrate-binding domain-containing protein [Dactylosporangium fulvum]